MTHIPSDTATEQPKGGWLLSQEHYDLIAMFEREFQVGGNRATKEEKRLWPVGRVYCHGETNELFLAYRRGYAYAKAIGRSAGA